MRFLAAVLLLFSTLCLHGEETYVDKLHKKASRYVKKISIYADNTLVSMANYIDNKEVNITKSSQSILKRDKSSVDSFFLNNKFLDETDQSYVSVRPSAFFSSKEGNEFKIRISAHLALSKSKQRFKLFINDLDQDNLKKIIADNAADEKKAPSVGINYFRPEKYGIHSKYSLGLRGVYPFVRARYNSEFHLSSWIIEPIQEFKYSIKDKFEEETQLFCDTKITNLSLFRLYLSRGTKADTPGMSYNAAVNLFYTPSENVGLSLSQYLNGSTKYRQVVYKDDTQILYEEYNGIYNYGTSLNIRQNFWRSWLFYEIEPGVNFHRLYDYKPNYTLRFLLDIFIEQI